MRTMRKKFAGVCILTVGFYVSLFIEGGTNGTHEEEKRKKDVMEQRAAEENAVRISWIRQKQMDVSFNCMLQFLNNGS